MENINGYIHGHPELDALSSEWYIFTYKGKLYQIAISIDSFHEEKEYDLKVFLFNKFNNADKERLSKVIETLSNNSMEINNEECKTKLTRTIDCLYSIIIGKQLIKGITLSSDCLKLINKRFNNKTVRDFIQELYNHLHKAQ